MTRAFLSCLVLLCAAPALAQRSERPPNLVLIVADDLGWGELGCYGQRHIRTPSVDRMAREGLRFTQFYAGNAVCAPSRCNLLTGLHPGHARIRNNGNPPERKGKGKAADGYFPGQNPLLDEDVTLAEVLAAKGYATACIGKWGLGYEGSTGDPNAQGFDLFYGYNCQVHAHNHYPRFLWRNGKKEELPGNDRQLSGETYAQDRFVEEALAFVRAHRERPFFLYLPFAVPHLSIQVPEASLEPYVDALPEEDYEHRGYLRHPRPRAGYAAMVTHMDAGVGRILDLLAELELDADTLVLFTSDNGPTHGRLGGSDSAFFESAGPFRGLKGSLYEGGIRVPLVARWPGRVPAGATSEHVAAFWDVLPTLAELAGAAAPEGLDGLSFAPALLGREGQREHAFLYWEFPGYGGQQAVRAGRWKGVRQELRAKEPRLALELYDLAADPGEARDVAARNPDVVARLEALLRGEHTPSALFPFPALDGR